MVTTLFYSVCVLNRVVVTWQLLCYILNVQYIFSQSLIVQASGRILLDADGRVLY